MYSCKIWLFSLRVAEITNSIHQSFSQSAGTWNILFMQGVKCWLTFANSNKHFHSAAVPRLLPLTVLVHIFIHDSSFRVNSLFPDIARQPGNVCFCPLQHALIMASMQNRLHLQLLWVAKEFMAHVARPFIFPAKWRENKHLPICDIVVLILFAFVFQSKMLRIA